MSYYFRLAVAVHDVTPGPEEVVDFLFWFVIFVGVLLLLELQIELVAFTDREIFYI